MTAGRNDHQMNDHQMNDPSALLVLAERCKCEEPSLELDEAIAFVIGWRLKEAMWWKAPGAKDWVLGAPCFSSSLDAVVTLVPKGWCWQGGLSYTERDAWMRVFPRALMPDGTGNISAQTPALALCAASLRARAAMQDEAGASNASEPIEDRT